MKNIINKSNIFISVFYLLSIIVVFLIMEWRVGHEPQSYLVKGWRLMLKHGHTIGSGNASTKIIFFFDYECGECSMMNGVFQKLLSDNPKDISITYMYYPHNDNYYSSLYSLLSYCASKQVRFEKINSSLFQYHVNYGDLDVNSIARYLGVSDMEKFDGCMTMARKDTSNMIAKDLKIGSDLKIPGTPAIIINGKMYFGMVPERLISKEIKKNS